MATNAVTDLEPRVLALFASDPVEMADPYPLYAELRETAAVHRLPSVVLVTRYAEARDLIRDGERYSAAHRRSGSRAAELRARLTEAEQRAFDDFAAHDAGVVSRTDGALHDRLRAIVHRAFTPRRIAGLEAAAQSYVDEFLDAAAEHEVADLMTLAYRLPLYMVCDLLDIPPGDRDVIHAWSRTISRNRGGEDPVVLMAAHEALVEFRGYIAEIYAAQRRTPDPNGLIAALVDAEKDDRMSLDEVVATYVVALSAGHETTTNLIGTGALGLLRQRAAWERLCADPSLIPQAVEELLRFVSPVQWTGRVALEDVVVDGVPIPAGTTISVMNAAANRDPRVFADGDSIDLTRANAGAHIALGLGLHYCLGASLARLEGAVALRTLAERFPRLELAADTFTWEGYANLRRLGSLPVRLCS